jgi:hypothetical protein
MTRGTYRGYKLPKRVDVEQGTIDEMHPAVRVILSCGHSYIQAIPAMYGATAASWLEQHRSSIGRRERCLQCMDGREQGNALPPPEKTYPRSGDTVIHPVYGEATVGLVDTGYEDGRGWICCNFGNTGQFCCYPDEVERIS